MYKLKQILTGATFALITGLATMSGNALAMTPDGETPANEGVCDGLIGGTGGLYGLCVAYCEAQDLHTVIETPPSLKILANYRKKMQPGDSDMPCVKTSCPCWTDAELSSMVDMAACSSANDTAGDATKTLAIGLASETHEALADTIRDRCSYVDLNLESNVVRTQRVSPDHAAICLTQLEAACDAAGK